MFEGNNSVDSIEWSSPDNTQDNYSLLRFAVYPASIGREVWG